MKLQGTVISWFDDKGYGFVRPDRGGDDVFLHMTDVHGRRRPKVGSVIRFDLGTEQGKARAQRARLTGFALAPITAACLLFLLAAAATIALKFAWAVDVPWPLLIYGAVSFVTFFYYAHDKRRAGAAGRRVPEAMLHGLELAGGWPGALLAQRFFRHKSQKKPYQLVFWFIVVVHLAAWGWWFSTR